MNVAKTTNSNSNKSKNVPAVMSFITGIKHAIRHVATPKIPEVTKIDLFSSAFLFTLTPKNINATSEITPIRTFIPNISVILSPPK